MHSGMRRVPAERARHAKRLGHVQAGTGPAPHVLATAHVYDARVTASPSPSAATATTSSSTLPSTSLKPPSSSALPSSSPTSSPSSALSSAPRSSTSSDAFSSSTPSLGPSPVPSSSVVQPITLTSTSATSSPSSTPQSASAATNNGLSGPAIAGIIAGAVIVGIALIVFFVRKTYLRRRENKRISWNGAPGLGAGFRDEPKTVPDTIERSPSFVSAANTTQRGTPLSPFEPRGASMYPTPVSPVAPVHLPTIPAYAIPTPPSATYNNLVYPIQPVSLTYSPADIAAHAMARGAADTGISHALHPVGARRALIEAIVKCTFVPTLPDELSITTGERVFVVEQYDDGWNLCMNGRGDRGMVPRECLEHTPSDQLDIGWKNDKRLSSLNHVERRF